MKDIKFKKVKLSPHTRDKMGLFARDYDRDIYLEKDVWSPDVFESKAYPETYEKYFYFKFNQDVYSNNNSKNVNNEIRDKELARLEAEEEKRYETEKYIAEQLALEKAQEKQKKEEIKKARVARPTPPKPKTSNDVQNKRINKLNIQKHDKANPIEELFFQAIEENGFKK